MKNSQRGFINFWFLVIALLIIALGIYLYLSKHNKSQPTKDVLSVATVATSSADTIKTPATDTISYYTYTDPQFPGLSVEFPKDWGVTDFLLSDLGAGILTLLPHKMMVTKSGPIEDYMQSQSIDKAIRISVEDLSMYDYTKSNAIKTLSQMNKKIDEIDSKSLPSNIKAMFTYSYFYQSSYGINEKFYEFTTAKHSFELQLLYKNQNDGKSLDEMALHIIQTINDTHIPGSFTDGTKYTIFLGDTGLNSIMNELWSCQGDHGYGYSGQLTPSTYICQAGPTGNTPLQGHNRTFTDLSGFGWNYGISSGSLSANTYSFTLTKGSDEIIHCSVAAQTCQ